VSSLTIVQGTGVAQAGPAQGARRCGLTMTDRNTLVVEGMQGQAVRAEVYTLQGSRVASVDTRAGEPTALRPAGSALARGVRLVRVRGQGTDLYRVTPAGDFAR
jgi:hypothetical protein